MTKTFKIALIIGALGALGAIGQSVSGSNALPVALATISSKVRADTLNDCSVRGLSVMKRGTRVLNSTTYVADNKQINVHVILGDALGNEQRDVRCVYTPDGAMFVRGS